MKMLNKIWIIIVLAITIVACENNNTVKNEREENDLQKEIFTIHDRLMSQSYRIVSLQEKLKSKLLTMRKAGLKGKDTLSISSNIKDANIGLDSSNQSMMNWMSAFKVDFKGKDHEETINYLQSEFQKIKKIDTITSISIQVGETLMNPKQ